MEDHPSNAPMTVACPSCGVPAGVRCLQKNKIPAAYPHFPRVRVSRGEPPPAPRAAYRDLRDAVLAEVEEKLRKADDGEDAFRHGLVLALDIVSKMRGGR